MSYDLSSGCTRAWGWRWDPTLGDIARDFGDFDQVWVPYGYPPTGDPRKEVNLAKMGSNRSISVRNRGGERILDFLLILDFRRKSLPSQSEFSCFWGGGRGYFSSVKIH